MGFGSKCCIWNGQVIYIEKSKLNIADMWLIPLDRVTYTHDTAMKNGEVHHWRLQIKIYMIYF